MKFGGVRALRKPRCSADRQQLPRKGVPRGWRDCCPSATIVTQRQAATKRDRRILARSKNHIRVAWMGGWRLGAEATSPYSPPVASGKK